MMFCKWWMICWDFTSCLFISWANTINLRATRTEDRYCFLMLY